MMMRRAFALLLLLLTAATASAQFADDNPFPVSNTRYGPAGVQARPVMASSGSEFLLVWWTSTSIRVAKTVAGVERPRVGRPVLPAEAGQFDEPSVVWNGSRFLVASNYGNAIVGRLLFANGEPASDMFTILANAYGAQLASNGSRILMLYRPREFGGEVRAVTLTLDGQPAGNDQLITVGEVAQAVRWYDVASDGAGFAAIIGGASSVEVDTFRGDGALASHFDAVGAVPFGTRVTRHVAIAAGSGRYLTAWSEPGAPLRGVMVSATGTITPTTPIDTVAKPTDVIEVPAIAWNGTRFDLAWIYGGAIRTAHIDANAAITAGAGVPGRGAWPSLAAANGRTLLAWSEARGVLPSPPPNPEGVNPTLFGGVINVRELGFKRLVGEGFLANYAAAEQILLGAAAGADSSIVVWTERTAEGDATWYGVRGRDGSWTEQRIAPEARAAFVASDGRNFMIVMNSATGALATHVSSSGVTLEPLSITGIRPTGVTWNGTNYAVVGHDLASVQTEAAITATLFTPTSIVVKNLLLRAAEKGDAADPVIAASGSDFLLAWLTRGGCTGAACPVALQLLRLDNTLTRIEANATSLAAASATDLDATWNGSNYGVAVANGAQVVLYRLPSRGAALAPLTVFENSGHAQTEVSVERVGGDFALGWRENDTSTGRAAIVANDGAVAARFVLDPGQASTTGPVLFRAPGNTLAYAASLTQMDAPHHGAERVMMRIDAPTPRPGAPRLQAGFQGDAIVLEWTLPAGPVSGYRVEYRANDGSWNEFEGWLSPSDRSVNLAGLPRGYSYHFRVRAWSDSGTGPYSNEVLVTIGGRARAVR